MDLASSIQVVLEDVILKLSRSIKSETGLAKLCLAGGVALNCVANGRLHREKIFEEIWIQPAAGDAGGAIGAALASYFLHFKMNRTVETNRDLMKGAYLGPEFSDACIREYLDRTSIRYEELESEALIVRTVSLLTEGQVVGWFQGKMEFGPRALGNRSILGDPRNPQMQSIMNLKVKKRESFRPFAPAIVEEKVQDYFANPYENPYMIMTSYLQNIHRLKVDTDNFSGIELLKQTRSTVPAITHVDYSARVQTVSKKTNPLFHRLIEVFDQKTNCPMLINTSFNVRGEPIVCGPEDALACFLSTEIEYLIIGGFVIAKHNQHNEIHNFFPKKNYTLD
jgi:carbamoyltransferase